MFWVQGFGDVSAEKIQKYAPETRAKFLKAVARRIDEFGQCPGCDEWALLIDEYGREVHRASESKGVRQIHTTACCILALQERRAS